MTDAGQCINTIGENEVEARERQDASRRGLALYESRLKAKLEPEYDNQFIAIHPDSEDYAVADSRGNALRAIRRPHPAGRLLLMKIGSEPEYGLAARILMSEMRERANAK